MPRSLKLELLDSVSAAFQCALKNSESLERRWNLKARIQAIDFERQQIFEEMSNAELNAYGISFYSYQQEFCGPLESIYLSRRLNKNDAKSQQGGPAA